MASTFNERRRNKIVSADTFLTSILFQALDMNNRAVMLGCYVVAMIWMTGIYAQYHHHHHHHHHHSQSHKHISGGASGWARSAHLKAGAGGTQALRASRGYREFAFRRSRIQQLRKLPRPPDSLERYFYCLRSNRGGHTAPTPPGETSLSLKDILPLDPKTYDKNRPPKVQGQPTIVYFHVTVLSLDSINEESMTYVADIFLAQSWRDSRLRLPEYMSEEYRILDVEWLKDIWRPDCFFKNAKKVTFHEMSIPNHYLWLYHDKTLLYMSKLTLVLSCAMKFESYPHDTQVCSMMIESLSHTVHDLVFLWNMTDPLVVNPEIELPQLDISNNYTADCTIEYSTGNFTCLVVVFNLRRRLGYHLFHTYIPSALIVVMSWISFWIKPEAIPARVTLGVTSLLTLATQNTQSQKSLPPVSYVKAIDVWMSSCSVFVFLSLMEFAVVNNYMGPVATKAMKGYSEEDIRSALDDFKELDTCGQGPVQPMRPITATIPQYATFCNGRETALYIDKVSRFFFPFSFFILNVVYWSTFL